MIVLVSDRLHRLAQKLDRPGYPWYVRAIDWATGHARQIEWLLSSEPL